MESTFEKIVRKSGRKPVSCKCNQCKQQCKTPCLGTPADIEKLIDAGYGGKIKPTVWAAGILMGCTDQLVHMYQLEMTNAGCILFKDGLCSIHNTGLKPTEGRLSHHSQTPVLPNKNLTWLVAKEWLDDKNIPIIERIIEKMSKIEQNAG